MHEIIENQLKIHPPEATSIQVFAEPSRLSLCYNVGKMLFNDLELVPGGTPRNSWWGVPPGSPNPDRISDRKMSFSLTFSDQASKIHTRFQDLVCKKLCHLFIYYLD